MKRPGRAAQQPAAAGLRYLYVGSADVERDLRFYVEGLGGTSLGVKTDGGTTVGAVRLGSGPPVLLASHRPAGTVVPVWSVKDLAAVRAHLRRYPEVPISQVELPDGPCLLIDDPSGLRLAFLEVKRPDVFKRIFGGARGETRPSTRRQPRPRPASGRSGSSIA